MPAASLSADAVRRARVWAQGLFGDSGGVGGAAGVAGVADAVRRVVGVQAQDVRAAALSIRPRGRGLVLGDVEQGVREGAIVLTWTLRGTRHYHAREDVRPLVGLFGPVFGRPGRRARQLGIDGDVGDRAVRALRRALETSGPLTRPQVRELLAPLGVDPSGQAPVHVLFRAACEGVLCVVPEPGRDERYVLLDDWVPASPSSVGPDEAAAEQARRYLGAFGPATPADLAAWSGLPAAVVQGAWAAVAPDLAEVATPTGPAWMLGERADALGAVTAEPAPVRLLGGYDTFVLGYADRSLYLPAEHAKAVNAGGGVVRPVVLDDGRVVGTWALRRGRSYDVDVMLFPGETPDAQDELADVARFLHR